jgi:hypothetical protein
MHFVVETPWPMVACALQVPLEGAALCAPVARTPSFATHRLMLVLAVCLKTFRRTLD